MLRPPSLHSLLDVSGSPATHGVRGGKGPWELKLRVIEAVNEMIDELDGVPQQIAEQALEHIHTDEVILTLGYSRATSLFLRAAGKKRDFQVVVAEGAPLCSGRRMARELSGAGIQTTFITDATVFAMMARSNMVVVGASALRWSESSVVGCRSCGRVRALGVQRALLLGRYGTLLFAERWKTEFGASIKQVRCSFGCVRVAKLLRALAAQPCCGRSRAGFVARRHGGACDRSPQDENKQASARRTAKTRLRICNRSAASETTAIRSRSP